MKPSRWTSTLLSWAVIATAASDLVSGLASAQAALQIHAPRAELECEAECWIPDMDTGSASYANAAQNWGAQSETDLMWQLRDEQCPSPGLLVHSRLIGAEASDDRSVTHDDTYSGSDSEESSYSSGGAVVYGDFGPLIAAEYGSSSGGEQSSRSFSNRTIRTHSHHSSVQMQFDMATPANSCHASRTSFPQREIGGNRVGG